MSVAEPNDRVPATAYSYLRLSSARQITRADKDAYRDGYRRQIELRDQYLELNDHLTLDTKLVLHDLGVSGWTGANMARGGTGKLAAFRREVEEGRIAHGSYLLVESLDRLTRAHVNRALELLLGLVNNGIIVVTLADGKIYRDGANPTQFLVSIVEMMRSFGESERKSFLLRKTWENKRATIGQRKLTARGPAWLRFVDGRFEQIDARVEIVRRIFEELAADIGRDSIARRLNKDKIEPWGKGREWHGGTVQKITDNPAVRGHFQPNRLEKSLKDEVVVAKRVPAGEWILDYYPQVVDDTLWFKARAVAERRRPEKAANPAGRKGKILSNLFGDLATCASCCSPMNYRDRGVRSSPVLRCSGERNGRCNNSYRFPYLATEDVILTWALQVDVGADQGGKADKLEVEAVNARGRREELMKEGAAVMGLVAKGNRFTVKRVEDIDAEVTTLERRLGELEVEVAAARAAGSTEWRAPAIKLLSDLFFDEATDAEHYLARSRIRQMLRQEITSMACEEDGHIHVVTTDLASHTFKDGYWLKDGAWLPSGWGLLGLNVLPRDRRGHPIRTKSKLAAE
jgi:DNA invertase Pin-like site-specific DNA recombinase